MVKPHLQHPHKYFSDRFLRELLPIVEVLYSFGGTVSPRPDVSEERKDQILDAASELFAEKGVHETRMDDIVTQSGLSKGTLYWYFKSKDEIVLNIFERIFSREFEELENLVNADGTATERLLYFSDRACEDVKKMLRLMPLAYEFMGWAFRKKFVQDAFKLYINKFMDILVPVIQQGIDTGEFRDIDPQSAAIALGAIFEGTLLLWVYDQKSCRTRKTYSGRNYLVTRGSQNMSNIRNADFKIPDPPRGIKAIPWRLPIWLYRLKLGGLLGRRMLLLTHKGRVSGEPRRAVLEVIHYDNETNTPYVASGFGEKSQWFQNITQTPEVHFQIGNKRFWATAKRLPEAESVAVFRDYHERHPNAIKNLSKMIGYQVGESEEDILDFMRKISCGCFSTAKKDSIDHC